LTTEAEFSENIGKYDALVTLLVLKNIDSVAPALSLFERETLYNKLTHHPVIPFIPSFNVRDLQFNLPDREVYKELKEINVDEFNISRILQMIKNNLFPNLHSLTFSVSRPIMMNTMHLRELRSLTLDNISENLQSLPDLTDIKLDTLCLSGYVMEFTGDLPRFLKLCNCYVKDSVGLLGCETMKLVNTRWNAGSLPTKSLSIEQGSFSRELPDTLDELRFIDVSMNADVPIIPHSLRSLHLDSVCLGLLEQVKSIEHLDTLVLDTKGNQISLPKSVDSLTLSGTIIEGFPSNVTSVDLYSLVVNCANLLNTLPRSVTSLQIVKCILTSNDIQTDTIPESLKTLRIIECKSSNYSKIEPVNTLDELIVIDSPFAVIDNPSSTSRYLCAKTNVLLMDIREFRLFCIGQSSMIMFDKFELCYDDITNGVHWKKPEELKKYMEIFLSYPYKIPRIRASLAGVVLSKGNVDTVIKVGTKPYTVKSLKDTVKLLGSGALKGDKELDAFIRELTITP
jgi:hypothetical protein